MGFSLSNLIRQGTAQINPWDHGQTAATVRQQQQRPQAVAQLPAPGQTHAAPAQPNFFHQAAHVIGQSIQHSPIPNVYQALPQVGSDLKAIAGLATRNGQATTHALNQNFHQNLQQLGNDVNNLQQFTTRPAAQIAATAAPIIHAVAPAIPNPIKNGTIVPTNPLTKAILGNTPVQSVQQGIRTNYQQHQNLPTPLRMGLAGAYGAGQVVQDIPVLGAAKSGAKIVGAEAKDIVTAKPFRQIPDNVIQAASRVRQSQSGWGDTMANVQPNDVKLMRQMQQKLGIPANDTTSVDRVINARTNYDTKMAQRTAAVKAGATKLIPGKGTSLNEGGYVRLPGRPTALMATHNLSEDNLAHAHELGGIPQASVGIVDPAKHAIDGYGDITLVGNEKLVNPKAPRTNTYASDVYSPRQPRAYLSGNDSVIKALRDKFQPAANDINQRWLGFDSANNLDEAVANEPAVMAQFLKDNGQKITSTDRYDLQRSIRDANLSDKFTAYAAQAAKDAGAKPTLWAGFTPSGNRRELPATMENTLKLMRKEGQRGGEDMGGIGNMRSHITPKFNSLEDIYKNKNKLTNSQTMEAVKETLDNKLNDVQAKLDKYAANRDPNQFSEYDHQMSAIRDYLAGGKNTEWFHQKFPNVPASATKALDDFKNELQHAPTEYFESVSDRAVQLQEFEKALVPENASPSTLAILKQHGIQPIFYKEGQRQQVLQRLMKEDNKARGFASTSRPGSHHPTIMSNAVDAAKKLLSDQSGHIGVPKKLQQIAERNQTGSSADSIAPTAAPSTTPALESPTAASQPLPKQPDTVSAKPGVGSLSKPKTGVVDKQLQEIEKARKQVVNYTADEIRQASKPVAGIRDQIGKNGIYVGKNGLPEDYRDLPAHLRSTDPKKPTIDVVATNHGFETPDDLIKAIKDNAPTKAMTKAEAIQEAQKQLESGQHPYSADYKQIKDALTQRQNELSLYPNGKYRQVKVTAKPQNMSDAELQSLASTPEGRAPKTTNKVLERNPKTALRNADAERQVQDVLRKGGSNEEALNTYMKASGVDLQTAVKDVRRVAQESNLGFSGGKNPLEGTVKLPTVQAGDHDQAFLNADFVKQHEQAVGQKALDAFNGLSEHDKTLLQDIEKNTVSNVAKQAENPAKFQAAEHAIRTYYDTRHAYDKALGIDVGYRQNYLRQLFQKAEDEAHANMPEQQTVRNGNKAPGYTQQRSYDTLNTHVGTALERDIAGSSSNHARLTYAKGIEEAYPGKVNTSGQMVRGDEGNYHQLTNRYGDAILADKSIADKINSRSYTDTENKFLQKYDKANAGIKFVKLGGGSFHAVTEAGNFLGQQLVSGKLFTEPEASGTVLKSFFSPKTMDAQMNRFRANGTLDKASLSGLKIMGKDILADANVSVANKVSKYSGIKALHDATFEREIPYAKLKLFEQKTKGMDVNNPADLAKMRSVAKGVNDLFGGMNRDIGGSIRPKEFKVLQRMVLATDFTEGKMRTALRAINITDNTPAAQLARQAVVGKALLFAALAGGSAAVAGDYKGKTPKQIAIDIASKLADPKFKAGSYSVAFPATHVSEFTKPFTPLFQSKTSSGRTATTSDRLKGIQRYATNRLAAVPSEGLQLWSNKDANGNRIYGKDYKANGGNNISPAKTALNVASGFTPIPVGQAFGVGSGRVNVPAAVANTIGLRATNESQYNNGNPNTQDKNGNNLPTGITSTNTGKFKTLQGSVMRSFNSLQDAKNAQAKNEFKYSNKTEATIAGQQYHKTASGKVEAGPMPATTNHSYKLSDGSSVKSKDVQTAYTQNTATLTSAKQSGDLNGYLNTARQQLANISKQLQDPKISATKAQQLANDAQALNKDIYKYGSYRGFSKPTGVTAVKTIGTINGARSDYVSNITKSAAKYGVDANAALAVASAEGLGGGVGDNGTSFGPFQLHVGGALPTGKNQAWAESPAGIDYAMQLISKAANGKTGQAAIAAIVNGFERPADPNGEIARALSVYNGSNVAVTPGSPNSAVITNTGGSGGATDRQLASSFSGAYSNAYKYEKSLRDLATKASMGKVKLPSYKGSKGAKLKGYKVAKGTTNPRPKKAFA